MTTDTLVLRTTGLSEQKQSELSVQLAFHSNLDFQHLSGSSFDLLGADVIMLGTDVRVGQEMLGILRRYAGAGEPLLVSYSEHDERLRAPGGMRGEPSFAGHLSQGLQRAGCRKEGIEFAIPEASEHASNHLTHEGPAAEQDTQWMP